MRLAYFSPLPPTASGISDYSTELLPFLARHVEIELFADTPSTFQTDLPVHPYREFFAERRASEFDLPIYHMGNSAAHAFVYAAAQRFPGVLVLHDVVLHHFFAWLTLERGDAQGYIELMCESYGDAGVELARAEIERRGSINRFALPLCESLIRNSSALIVHSEYAARFVSAVAPEKPLALVRMGVPLPEWREPVTARARLNLSRAAFIVGIFGEVAWHKRVTIALDAFREFHARHPHSLLLLVGRVSPNYDVVNLIRRFGLQGSVRVTGFAERDAYESYIAACDVCLNLRYPTAGETSASALRLLAAARPVLVTRADAYTELPETACVKIEPDEFERAALVAHFEFFATHPEFARAMGEYGRRYVATNHTLESAARTYVEFLQNIEGWKERKPKAERTEAEERRQGDQKTTPIESKFQIANSKFPPPTLNFQGSISIGQAIAELGLDADDPVLREIAKAQIEIEGTSD